MAPQPLLSLAQGRKGLGFRVQGLDNHFTPILQQGHARREGGRVRVWCQLVSSLRFCVSHVSIDQGVEFLVGFVAGHFLDLQDLLVEVIAALAI